jgi:hypothetical protein
MAFVDLCRLCGTDTLNILRNAIFKGEGSAKKYALKISECLILQVGSKFLSRDNSAFENNFTLWILGGRRYCFIYYSTQMFHSLHSKPLCTFERHQSCGDGPAPRSQFVL